MLNYLIKSINGNLIHAEFQRIDPAEVLSGSCLEAFYDAVNQYNDITTSEWNKLIFYIQQLEYQLDDFADQQQEHCLVNN